MRLRDAGLVSIRAMSGRGFHVSISVKQGGRGGSRDVTKSVKRGWRGWVSQVVDVHRLVIVSCRRRRAAGTNTG